MLAQGAKELRKEKGLSQEELAKSSGLSLRTIQRFENGETEPSGETLRRISSALDLTPKELMEWGQNKDTLKKTVKAKHEYLHIFDSKLVFSKTPEIEDLVGDYGKSVNNAFKSLMVFLVFIPIFTALAVVFYNMEKFGLALYVGSFGLFFLTLAFYYMLFTSGSSSINKESIHKIKIKRRLNYTVLEISYNEFGRFKKRGLIFEKHQVEPMKNVLLSQKLIEKSDISLKGNKGMRVGIIVFMGLFCIIPSLLNLKSGEDKSLNIMMYYGFYVIILCIIVISIMVIRFLKPSFNKNNKPLTRAHK
ncbi:helix-turn-helix domain-containing protein [Formosa sp. PL04]|uniref:helix-turn-helix domain-containing protein n=1 Tax=Formosa sp. PL04 TaxID=3081755 RepID=UPI002980C3A7|nr:helix-turn-helix domain-containing protein [Formosa sp. PL04]MDW5288773.1 helix-turn-helix domain-containing protein [Formosa sp. PL04]